MKIKIKPLPADPRSEWHEWFAWVPVIVKEAGYWTANSYSQAEYLVWWRYVLRSRLVVNGEIHWRYEAR